MKIPYINSRLAARIFIPLIFASVCSLTGCLSRPYLNKQTFAFSSPEETVANSVIGNHVLSIRSLQIAAPFEGRSLVYRTGEFSYERDPYAEFLESPDQELVAPLRDGLLKGAGFSAVVGSGSVLKPDILVEINVSQFFGDFRQPEHPAAVMAVQFVFFDATNNLPGKVIFQKEYSRSILLNEPTAAGLMAGWNEALTQIIAEVSSDLQPAKTGPQGQEFPSRITDWLHL